MFLLFVAAFSMNFAAAQVRDLNSWVIGDWLINYSGGFVRRGLTGALVMLLHRATGISLNWIVFSLYASVLLLLLVCVYKLAEGIRWSYLMTAVILSPATLAFTVLDPQYAGLRKEILLFAGLAVIIWALTSERLKDWQLIAMLSVVLVVVTLSHEGMVVAVPFLFAAVAIQMKSLRRAAVLCATPFVLGGIALGAAVLHHGNLAITQAICSSVGGYVSGPGIIETVGGSCSGAITTLQLSASSEHAGIIVWIRRSHLLALYGMFAVPTFVPLLLLYWELYRRDRLRYEVAVVLGCFLASLPGIALLMYVGSDWGRWFHIEAMSLMLLAMMIDRKAAARRNAEPVKRYPVALRVVATVAVFLYVTTWTLPAIGTGYERQGYLALTSPTYRYATHCVRAAVVKVVKSVV